MRKGLIVLSMYHGDKQESLVKGSGHCSSETS